MPLLKCTGPLMAKVLPLSPAADLKDRPLHRDRAPTNLNLDSQFFCHKYFPNPWELTQLIHREVNVADGNCHVRGRGVSFPRLSGSLRCMWPGPSGIIQSPDSSQWSPAHQHTFYCLLLPSCLPFPTSHTSSLGLPSLCTLLSQVSLEEKSN